MIDKNMQKVVEEWMRCKQEIVTAEAALAATRKSMEAQKINIMRLEKNICVMGEVNNNLIERYVQVLRLGLEAVVLHFTWKDGQTSVRLVEVEK